MAGGVAQHALHKVRLLCMLCPLQSHSCLLHLLAGACGCWLVGRQTTCACMLTEPHLQKQSRLAS